MTVPARQLRLDLARAPSHAREDFVVSASNKAAVDTLDAWPLWPGGKIALVGPAGGGKTHLASAWAARVGALRAKPGGRSGLPANSGPLLLEDADRQIDEDLLFHLMNVADTGSSLLVTGRTEPRTWNTRLPDMRSRLNALTTVYIGPPDDAVLIAVMKKLFSERNIQPKRGVYAFVIRRIERSVPAVQDIVRRIDEFAASEKRDVNRALVAHIFQNGV